MAEHDDEDIEGEVRRDEELDPEREARRRIALAQIRQYPDAALKMKARPVDGVRRRAAEPRRADEAADARRERHRPRGDAGRRAPPRSSSSSRTRTRSLAVVNPEIVERSEETDVADEGCLSIQGITVPVERSLEVTIVGKDENGDDVRYELDGYAARCVQHETDHLDGVLMIDRTTPEARREALGMLRPRIVLT